MKSELEEEIENLAYENKQMALFIELLGVTPNEITDYVINGSTEQWDMLRKRMNAYTNPSNWKKFREVLKG